MGAFATNVSDFVKKTKLKPDLVIRKVALDAFNSILHRSPVDTGRFRGSWRIGINRVDPSFHPAVVKAGEVDAPLVPIPTGEEISKANFGDTVHITNNLPYARLLEEGSSDQAPSGMVQITLDEINASLQRTVDSLG